MSKLSLLAALLPAAFFATLTVAPSSYSFAAVIIAFVSLLLLPKTYRALYQPYARLVSLSLLLYWLLYLFTFTYHGEPISSIDLPSRTLLAMFSLWFFLTYPPRLSWIMSGMVIGSVISGIIALVQAYGFDNRAFNHNGYMVIQIGGICAWLAAFSAISFIYFHHYSLRYRMYIALAATGLALAASLLSGARGSWVPTPFVLGMIIWFARHYVNKRMVFSLLAVWCVTFVAVKPKIDNRIDAVASDLTKYEQQNSGSSTGIRLELWKSALYAAAEHPLTGIGHSQLPLLKQQQVQQGLVDKVTLSFSRAHNQFLEELQTKGIIGLLGLILVFALPFWLFVSRLFSPQAKASPALFFSAMLGCAHILMVCGFCMTQHYLIHHSGILMYSFGTAILAAVTINLNRTATERLNSAQN
ncbi:O-antigen ligase family protein [Vibrio sp. CDRSL-10 TSBA]